MKLYQMADPVRYGRMTTEELRETFLVEELFRPDAIDLVYVDLDRTVIGSAVPVDSPLELPCPTELRADYFCERREIGVMNVGGIGTVTVDGKSYPLAKLDCLYIGRGSKAVSFASADSNAPAAFYLLSYPAHAEYKTMLVGSGSIPGKKLGSAETCNARTIYQAIVPKRWDGSSGVQTCQLVMGFTLLEKGSNWNTMPPHTHMRRSEIYMYFDVEADQRVMHLMGPPQETKHLVIANKQVAISPGWSIHAGVGTKAYGFCWGMGGENQAYDDMDGVAIADLK